MFHFRLNPSAVIFGLMCVLFISACSTQPKPLSSCEIALTSCQNQLQLEQQKLLLCQQNIEQLNTRRDQLDKHLEECQLTASEMLRQQQELNSREARLRQLLEQELRDKNVEIENLKGRLTLRMLNRILFDSGSAEILASGRQVLDKVANAITHLQDKIRIVGHTDNVRIGIQLKNRYPSNWELSAARASSVVRYFEEQHQIAPLRLEAVGLSKYHPLAPNDNDENRQRNRRVEIILTPVP